MGRQKGGYNSIFERRSKKSTCEGVVNMARNILYCAKKAKY
jgi:hypothetical protein